MRVVWGWSTFGLGDIILLLFMSAINAVCVSTILDGMLLGTNYE